MGTAAKGRGEGRGEKKMRTLVRRSAMYLQAALDIVQGEAAAQTMGREEQLQATDEEGPYLPFS